MAGTNEAAVGSNTKSNTKPVEKRTVFLIIEGEKGKLWKRVGVAFVNKDGSLNLYLKQDIANGTKLHIREEKARVAPPAEAPVAA